MERLDRPIPPWEPVNARSRVVPARYHGGVRLQKERGISLTTSEITAETLEQVLDAFSRHDLDTIMAFFAEDAVMEMPRGPDPWGTRDVGKVAVRDGSTGRFAGIPDVHYAEDQHWACWNHGVSEWLMTGGKHIDDYRAARGCNHWEFRNGQVVRKDSYWKIVE